MSDYLKGQSYQHGIKIGAHMFSLLKATRAMSEGSLEADIMATYTQLMAHSWNKPPMLVTNDMLEFYKAKGLP